MDAYESINKILVHLFNDIWGLEEKAVITEEFKDLTNNDMHIIEAVGLGDGNNMSTIAKKLGITVGSLTTSMNSLVNKKYAVRHRSEEDRRIVNIKLTEKGEKAVFDDAAKANVLMLQNGKLSHVEAVESDLTLWQVVANTINGEKVYSLVNKATNTSLSFDAPTAEQAGAYNSKATVTYFTAEQATTTEDRDQLKVYGVNDGYLVYNTSSNSFFVDTWSGSSFAHAGNTNLALSLEKVGSN